MITAEQNTSPLEILFYQLGPSGPNCSISHDIHVSICPISNSFKALALRADALYKSICQYVCLSVCMSVCSLLRYHLNVFLPQLPDIGCLKNLGIWNPWGKVMKRSGLRF